MVQGFEAFETKNGRVIVVRHIECGASTEEIIDLLAEAGVDPSNVVFLNAEEILQSAELDGAIILIPLNRDTCDEPDLENVGRHCAQAGGNVVVILETEFSYANLHQIADKYGTQCRWSAKELGQCILSGGSSEPTDSTGTALSRSGGKQVNC